MGGGEDTARVFSPSARCSVLMQHELLSGVKTTNFIVTLSVETWEWHTGGGNVTGSLSVEFVLGFSGSVGNSLIFGFVFFFF